MKNIFVFLWNRNADIIKGLLFAASVFLLLLLFPRERAFKYDYDKGRPWLHEDLIAPFDFAILKSDEEIAAEEQALVSEIKPYYRYKQGVIKAKRETLKTDIEKYFEKEDAKVNALLRSKEVKEQRIRLYQEVCWQIIDTVFEVGIIGVTDEFSRPDHAVVLVRQNVAEPHEVKDFFTIQSAEEYLVSQLETQYRVKRDVALRLLLGVLEYNVVFDEVMTLQEKKMAIDELSVSRGMVQKGEKVISQGDLVTNERFAILRSYQKEYERQVGAESRYNYILAGQVIMICVSLLVLFLFLYNFRKDIFRNNKKILIILIIILLMVGVTGMVIKTNVKYLYLVPLCIVPILVRAFFDTRLALLVHIVTIIMIGFIVPNRFEFTFIQLIAGIIAIISMIKLQKRAQFFVTTLYVFNVYALIYTSLSLMQEGSFDGISTENYLLLGGSAMLTLFTYPLIFLFEKIFGFVTDVSLIELSDTNNKLLRELSMKAPGTFQHSLHVANLTEKIISEIGGDALLARTAALYHDIGKIKNPAYFIENQNRGINPHDDLSYEESARIIIQHVLDGIEIAKRNGLPEEVIDFIRTHHGTTVTGYFYIMQKNEDPEIEFDEQAFRYHGPEPFSKETAVLMMVDSVEAATRSIKEPDEKSISELVDKMIDLKMEQQQFINASITLKEIAQTRKIIKRQLMSFFHVRVEYPE